jgi:hypothetical protein
MEIAIPSTGNARTLPLKTLLALWSNGFSKDKITIFVALEEEEAYRASCRGYKIVAGVKGVSLEKEFILRYYPRGTPILILDDDIDHFNFSPDSKGKSC